MSVLLSSRIPSFTKTFFRCMSGRIPVLVLAAACIHQFIPHALSQEEANVRPASTGVALVSLATPLYPPIARTARIMGDVKIGLLIKKDGSIESTWVIAGPPMLIQAALDSVNKSKFECRACQEDSMPYTVTYTYNIPEDSTVKPDPCCCTYIPGRDYTPHPSTVTQSGNHITVSAEVPCICPDQCGIKRVEEDSKYRSLKCLYLWRCGNHHYGIM